VSDDDLANPDRRANHDGQRFDHERKRNQGVADDIGADLQKDAQMVSDGLAETAKRRTVSRRRDQPNTSKIEKKAL
jgi:hypothetical protein